MPDIEEARRKRNAAQKERYGWLKAHGICVGCGQRDAFAGRIYCEVCLEKNTQRRIANKDKIAQMRKERRQAENAKKRAQRKARKDAGLCTECGKPAVTGKAKCWYHAEKDRQRKRMRLLDQRGGLDAWEIIRERTAAGMCRYCGKPAVPGHRTCEEHLEIGRKCAEKCRANGSGFRRIIDASCRLAAAKKEAGEHGDNHKIKGARP